MCQDNCSHPEAKGLMVVTFLSNPFPLLQTGDIYVIEES